MGLVHVFISRKLQCALNNGVKENCMVLLWILYLCDCNVREVALTGIASRSHDLRKYQPTCSFQPLTVVCIRWYY